MFHLTPELAERTSDRTRLKPDAAEDSWGKLLLKDDLGHAPMARYAEPFEGSNPRVPFAPA